MTAERGVSPTAYNAWMLPAAFAVSVAIWLAMYGASLWSAVEIWSRSGTFTHGFVILPVVAYLGWRRRAELAAVPKITPKLAQTIWDFFHPRQTGSEAEG